MSLSNILINAEVWTMGAFYGYAATLFIKTLKLTFAEALKSNAEVDFAVSLSDKTIK